MVQPYLSLIRWDDKSQMDHRSQGTTQGTSAHPIESGCLIKYGYLAVEGDRQRRCWALSCSLAALCHNWQMNEETNEWMKEWRTNGGVNEQLLDEWVNDGFSWSPTTVNSLRVSKSWMQRSMFCGVMFEYTRFTNCAVSAMILNDLRLSGCSRR